MIRINTPNYWKATNAAYELLSSYNGDYPRINIFLILLNMKNVVLITYTQMAHKMGITYEDFCLNYASNEYGFTIRKESKSGAKFIVCYNERKSDTTIRFTLAHELAHIILGHKDDNDISRKEADCCARNILCPIPVVNGFGLKKPSDYADCFDISLPMAEIALEYASNDKHYITKDNYNHIDMLSYLNLSGMTLAELYGY